MFENEIEAGVAYLDRRHGRDVWLPKIDLETLDMSHNRNCIIGQAEGPYVGTDFAHDQDLADSYGFYITFESYLKRPAWHSRMQEWEILTDEWKATITALRG